MSGTAAPSAEIDAALVEEVVLRAVETAGAGTRRRFRAERDAVYRLGDPEARESGFRDLHARWFESLNLGEPLRGILAGGQSAPVARRCLVLRAQGPGQEGADLHDAPEGTVLVVRLRPRTLLNPESAVILLRRDLLHVSDMLDPEFGYTRELPGEGREHVRDKAIRDRYRILWDITVDGRLRAQKLVPEETERARRLEFRQGFPMLQEGGEAELFDRLFYGPRPRHEDLCALAAGPAAWAAPRCAVCDFPTGRLHPDPGTLDESVVSAIRADRPGWRRELGLCVQCADLYAARSLPSR